MLRMSLAGFITEHEQFKILEPSHSAKKPTENPPHPPLILAQLPGRQSCSGPAICSLQEVKFKAPLLHSHLETDDQTPR